MCALENLRRPLANLLPYQNTVDSAAGTPTPVDEGRVLLIHGYSSDGEDFLPWKNALIASGIRAEIISVGNYVTLNNEVTIKDLGEALDRALRLSPWSQGPSGESFTFDAIVHSTGMLVLRQWLTNDPFPGDPKRSRVRRLKHLVGLAPATFGSPQAKKGRSWLGALVKGNRTIGPDFLNAGDDVLDGLELASRYTWDLTHKDMLCADPFYDKGANTPYVAVFIGDTPYTGLASLVNPQGSDGTVRWAGSALNTRKITVDLRRESKLKDAGNQPTRCLISKWNDARLAAPMIAVPGRNHGTMLSQPHPEVVSRVHNFLQLSTQADYDKWEADALAFGQTALNNMNNASKKDNFGGAGWQQIVIHAIDDHGDGITDFNAQFYIGDDLSQSDDPSFSPIPLEADTYSTDNSYRCFYIRLSPDMLALNQPGGPKKKLWLELIASSGSALIEYEAYTEGPTNPKRLAVDHTSKDGGPVKLDITLLAQGSDSLLFPYTTTLLEIFVQREPMPLNSISGLFQFLKSS